MQKLETPYLSQKATLVSCVEMAKDNFLFEFEENKGTLSSCMPGQFVELWLPGVGEAPISVCSGKVDNKLQLLVRKVGRVTSALFDLKPGAWVGLRGPYGHGFPVDIYKGKDVCMIAGGLGVAPLRSLWQYLLEHRDDYGKLILIYGMRHCEEILFHDEINALMELPDIEVYLAAEDANVCLLPHIPMEAGRVTDLLDHLDISPDMQFAVCGPPVMYRFVVDNLAHKNVKDKNIWLSLERHMKCGFGKCGHCYIGGHFTCKEGPVFDLPALKTMSEVIEVGTGKQ
ncbi:MAG: FAD/NAD(P)-binding protein [Candidatus Obscuribacter sp.]|nr:FAD/NAD(P)-binding protein [Candidatus Obscuribacter sp.]